MMRLDCEYPFQFLLNYWGDVNWTGKTLISIDFHTNFYVHLLTLA